MYRDLITAAIAASISMTLAIFPADGSAQTTKVSDELARIRDLRAKDRVSDASDHADRYELKLAIEGLSAVASKESALWEVADVHLEAANRWPAGPDNGFARRAIDAWTAYVDFALEKNIDARIHRAVDFLQRSYIQASSYREMFAAFPRLPPKYVSDNVVTRWEDRLKTCPAYGQPSAQSWVERACMQSDCRDSVAEFYAFARNWLNDFALRTDVKSRFAARIDRVPQACRSI